MNDAAPDSLYQAHQKIYARAVQGRYARLRQVAVLILLGAYYLLPWLSIDGHPAVHFDLPARRFHILGLTFVPQDLIYLTWLLLISALGLFFVTNISGRVWCGYACPQTVWTEAFMWMERWTEGDRSQRIKLDRLPWTAPQRLLRKGAKQVLWIGFAALTGLTFVSYFTPIRELLPSLVAGTLGGWESFWIVFYGFATYGNAGYMREQVCKYMCPYARFQSAMFDRDTLIVSYDTVRGEPRKSLVKKLMQQRAPSAAAILSGERAADEMDRQPIRAGDCVDCSLCVQVCPTGIDIRNGLQYECIACAACIDACDSVMDHVKSPRGLIRYTTLRELEGGRTHLLRPRAIGYGLLFLALVSAFPVGLALRQPFAVNVIKDRNALYRYAGDRIENAYQVKITNKSDQPQEFTVRVSGLGDIRTVPAPARVHAGPGELVTFPLEVQVSPDALQPGVNALHFAVEGDQHPGRVIDVPARFMAPR